jgi:NAD(P)-dependent dehydrogenase (short-subunit alcohol dehydrogenase family)
MAIALVTGTSTGIGLATAITLGRAGHTVYAGMRNLERAGELEAVVAKEQLPVATVHNGGKSTFSSITPGSAAAGLLRK